MNKLLIFIDLHSYRVIFEVHWVIATTVALVLGGALVVVLLENFRHHVSLSRDK